MVLEEYSSHCFICKEGVYASSCYVIARDFVARAQGQDIKPRVICPKDGERYGFDNFSEKKLEEIINNRRNN